MPSTTGAVKNSIGLLLMEPGEEYAPKLNVLERHGLKFLRRWNERETWAVHPLSSDEYVKMLQVERWAIGWAAFAGALSGGFLGLFEVLMRRQMGGLEDAGLRAQIPYWTAFAVVAVVVAGAEVAFMYWYALRSAGRLSCIAGVRFAKSEVDAIIARGLVRAALEVPNPQGRIYGVDPYARTPRWKLALWGVLYRMKVGVTSFVLRVVLRRVLARAAFRVFIPLAAIPVYAIWNGVITWWAMGEARRRALGPLAVRDLVEHLARKRSPLSKPARELALQAVGELIIRTADAHPNYVLLLQRLIEVLRISPDKIRINWEEDRKGFQRLDARESKVVLRVLAVGIIIDGRIRKDEVELLKEGHELSGLPFHPAALAALCEKFMKGRSLLAEDFDGLWHDGDSR